MHVRQRAVWCTSAMSATATRRGIPAIVFILVALTLLAISPAKADFVCNAKTKLVNVFLEPPIYRQNVAAPAAGAKWSPADALETPFDIIDTLPSGARVKTHALSESEGWVWISFRHTQNGLVGNGYVHISRLSAIKCDADPMHQVAQIERGQYGLEEGDYFETGPDDPPLEAGRSAKRFQTSMESGAIRTSRVYVKCEVPNAATPRPDDLSADALAADPYIETCTELLASNPNFVEALITRGDIYHRFAKSPAPGLDSKSPKWAVDLNQRKVVQAKAIADWTRASLLLPKGVPTVLKDRLLATGPAGYEVK